MACDVVAALEPAQLAGRIFETTGARAVRGYLRRYLPRVEVLTPD